MSDKKTKGLMKILMVVMYKEYPVYIRRIGKEVFIWDTIIDNKLYSSYMVISPGKGRKRLTKDEVTEITKMCYAGACTTVDTHLGIKLEDKDEQIVEMFESARVIQE